jgi:hypothetical protein
MIQAFFILLIIAIIELGIIIFLIQLLLKKRNNAIKDYNQKIIDRFKYEKELEKKEVNIDVKIKNANNLDDILNIFDELQDYEYSNRGH